MVKTVVTRMIYLNWVKFGARNYNGQRSHGSGDREKGNVKVPQQSTDISKGMRPSGISLYIILLADRPHQSNSESSSIHENYAQD